MSRILLGVNNDPRAIRSRDAILRTVIDIIDTEGPSAVTHQLVAERAGVGRATVYRHWPKPVDLLFEAIEQVDFPFLEPDEAPLRVRLVNSLRRLRDDLSSPLMPSVIATLIDRAQRDSVYRQHNRRVVSTAVANMRAATEQAIERGELAGDPDPDILVSQLLGAMLFRQLIAGEPGTDAFINHIIDTALAPWCAGRALPRRHERDGPTLPGQAAW